jgi:hypothetical protein
VCIDNADIPDNHRPYLLSVREIFGSQRENLPHIVFQLKRPSYLMLRLYGSLVKSTLSSNASRPGKYSSKFGASSDNVLKTRPVGVT